MCEESPVNDEILTIDEAALYLKVKTDLISQLLESGDVPGRKVGGEWRTTRRALASFVDGVPMGGACCCVPVQAEAADGCCTPSSGRCC